MSHFAEGAAGHPTCAVEDYEGSADCAEREGERDFNPSIPWRNRMGHISK